MEQVLVRELRRLIVTGTLAPGVRLRYRDLAERFHVSVTPVRIALRDLAKEGLVEMKAHEGARVTPLSLDDLEDVYATRIGFESWLARRGAENLTPSNLVDMEVRLAEARQAVVARDRSSFLRSAWGLRCLCYEAAGRPRLLDIARTLYDRSARYHGLTLNAAVRFEESFDFLDQFNSACKAGDGTRAAALVQATLERGAEYIIANLTSAHDPSTQGGE